MEFIMREFEDADAAAFALAVNQSLDTLLPWMTWAHKNYTEDEARLWFHLTQLQRQQGTANELGLFAADGRLLGGAGIRYSSNPLIPCSLGYWVRSSEQRQGIASNAVLRLASHAFSQPDIDVIEILAAERNIASRTVAEKVGAKTIAIRYGLIVLDSGPVSTVIYHLHRPSPEER
ncbi:GNAT family N-acetyltransferase [Erwinia sp. SLM-02]|uniref:GNAT family N-acetyltransferase n=1 Tax=Erwinia sp. SLM-02 TaxID=3020057 RepID=UPI0028D29D5D|nr:GNAT family N-acetyltransferase [uncultured Erwinia sp.]